MPRPFCSRKSVAASYKRRAERGRKKGVRACKSTDAGNRGHDIRDLYQRRTCGGQRTLSNFHQGRLIGSVAGIGLEVQRTVRIQQILFARPNSQVPSWVGAETQSPGTEFFAAETGRLN